MLPHFRICCTELDRLKVTNFSSTRTQFLPSVPVCSLSFMTSVCRNNKGPFFHCSKLITSTFSCLSWDKPHALLWSELSHFSIYSEISINSWSGPKATVLKSRLVDCIWSFISKAQIWGYLNENEFMRGPQLPANATSVNRKFPRKDLKTHGPLQACWNVRLNVKFWQKLTPWIHSAIVELTEVWL